MFALSLSFVRSFFPHPFSIIKQISDGFYNLKHSEDLNLSPVTRLTPLTPPSPRLPL